MTKVQVALENGNLVMCRVIERMEFNHDAGGRTIWVEHDGKEFMAINRLGAWKKWGAGDRVRPLIDELERAAHG